MSTNADGFATQSCQAPVLLLCTAAARPLPAPPPLPRVAAPSPGAALALALARGRVSVPSRDRMLDPGATLTPPPAQNSNPGS